MKPNTLTTQPIGRNLAAAAAEALGGAPARPPVPRAPNRESSDQRLAREAFKAANTVAAPILIGHPTFDPVPDALGLRREKVAIVRLRLSLLAQHILDENAALQPLISELDPEAAEVLTSELFSTAIARSFLASLSQTVTALASPSETMSAEEADAMQYPL